MPADDEQLRHSVAFRVTESEWTRLQEIAERSGVTVPQLAKGLLFQSAGLPSPGRKRSNYGQVTGRRKSKNASA
jgi:hypothetical protein